MTVLVLLFKPTSAEQCQRRHHVVGYCSGEHKCTFSSFIYHVPQNNSAITYERGCGESTGKRCKDIKDRAGCFNSPQCLWWQTYNKDDNILRDYECREFDCSYGWTEDYCGQFKDCVFDKKDSKCKSKKQPKKSLWEIINDHAETATGKRLDGK
ncbi:hypothetical protein O0I10_009718 [Lichtheimia ornata]|uniref:Uncharacterized protein n=1 Tax=Lichtheimia ornata TaxID=688661 RepID=A0AAD7XYH9_9FUNG|nr:uncharacterized protein O0I10_009718 [Lichtheimia ornata]KAJ8654667.1 hypothetical protein O0I10_009718 [Lichtheimia ornata]